MTAQTLRSRFQPGLGLLIFILAVVTVVRLVGLTLSKAELFVDESQYWSWSRELDWGYFSKPPLLAWIIHVAEGVCGSGEACIRAPSSIIYFGTSLVIYFLVRPIYGAAAAFWAALLMAFGTGVVFSTRIISTDVPMLFFWALALLAYFRLLDRPAWPWAVVLGLSLGFGMLAKYAMGYFVLCMLLAAVFDRRARALLQNRMFYLALAIAVVVLTPNLIWVFNHHFAPLKSIAQNVDNDNDRFNVLRMLSFVSSQFGVIGPVIFTVLLVALAKIRSPEEIPNQKILLAFAVPPLAIITAVAFYSGANANWAASAIVSSTILAAAMLVHRKAWIWLALALGIGVLEQGVLLYSDANAPHFTVPFVPPKRADIYQRTLGFKELAANVRRFTAQIGARTVVGEDRRAISAILYYNRDEPQSVVAWPAAGAPLFDLTRPFTESTEGPLLFVSECPNTPRLGEYYKNVDALGSIHVSTGVTLRRDYSFYRLSGAKRPMAPLALCPRTEYCKKTNAIECSESSIWAD